MNQPVTTTFPSFEVVNPNLEPLELNRRYNVAGLINSNPIQRSYQTGKTLQRVSLITPRFEQCIIEIWNSSKAMEPIFAQKWQVLQFCFVKNATFHGMSEMAPGVMVYVFRLSQKYASNNRYIWLSSPKNNFWANPIKAEDFVLEITKAELDALAWPSPAPSIDGFLDMSSGSRFGKIWTSEQRLLHSQYAFTPYTFSDYERIRALYQRSVDGVRNVLTNIIADQSKLFDRYILIIVSLKIKKKF